MNATEQTQPTITFLNSSGDITIAWEKDKEEEILALVKAKMAENYRFFILKPRLGGFLGTKKVPADSVEQIRAAGNFVAPDALAKAIVMNLGDNDVSAVVQTGGARVANVGKDKLECSGLARNAQEVVQNNTLAVRQIVGG